MTKETETLTFHNEAAISRISLWANIIGTTILILSMIGFIQTAIQIYSNWAQISQGLLPNTFEAVA
ncbi:MAG: hypothetical protein QGD96_01595, partial [Anaerolineae bacterium]|nr:hypothetical protein [Anaerolineae bacterium]